MEPKPYRIASIDILRGIVMLIMAIDHTRDFFHVTAMTDDPMNALTTNPALYFTRWITHFCAPTFLFLSGISAYLASRRKTKTETGIFLIKRGLWLVLVEVVLITFGLTFNPFFNFIVLQVIWATGWSMFLLGIISMISTQLVLAIGLLLMFGHNILDYLNLPRTGTAGALWSIFFRSGNVIPLDSKHLVGVFYAILPWTGAMMVGYGMGKWFSQQTEPARRQRLLMITGISLVVLFVVLRATNLYGNPFPFVKGRDFVTSVYNFLNTSKYPPSLQYFCMTLGPSCIALALFENVRNAWGRRFSVYGSVPFFYYILHFYILHIILVIIFYVSGHTNSQIVSPVPFYFRPVTFGFTLPWVYLIWAFVVLLLYYPCKWFSNYKKQHRDWWLSYL